MGDLQAFGIERDGRAAHGDASVTLHEFLTAHRDTVLQRTRARAALRPAPRATEDEIENGIPLFLDQLVSVLRCSGAHDAIAEGAARYGASLLKEGFTVAQVVHAYGDVCQTVTELVAEMNAAIAADEFRVLNACLDDAIAGAVTEYERRREQSIANEGVERLGEFAHEVRNALGSATMSFEILRLGKVGFDGSTAGVLARSLRRLASLVDCSLTEVRLEAGMRSPARVAVRGLVEEIAVGASMEAHGRGLTLALASGDAGVDVYADRHLLAAAISNLLQNAFKFTRRGSEVSLSAHATEDRARVEVADACGGLPPGRAAELFRPFEQRSPDRTGLGLGLSISRKSVEACGGTMRVRDVPGTGCVFTIDLPRHAP